MARSLVIVESPAKARTINRYLGNDFLVKSSVGHIRDLPAGGKGRQSGGRGKQAAGGRKGTRGRAADPQVRARRQLVQRMGVDPDRGWRATYEVVPGKEKVVGELKKLAGASGQVFLATDLDREGEAIAWHLKEVIGGDPARFRRVVFNEITRRAIQDAFENPGEIDQNRVNAQQARRFLDRVVGFEVSPLLWAKVARGLSAGRVQSVAVRLVVEREREIRAFEPEEYWEVFADLTRDGGEDPCRFQVVRSDGKAFRPRNKNEADDALARLRREAFTVARVESRPTTTRPGAPFITSTLQQAASTRLGFGVRKTMTLAQRLYEGGHITYMRTDSTNLSREAVAGVRAHIEAAFGARYLPKTPNAYASKAGAQEAHEAIRPTDVAAQPETLAVADADARRLYDLVRRQFIACQMTAAEYMSTTVTVAAGDFELRVRGRVLRFDGFTRVLPPASRKGDLADVPGYEQGEGLACAKLESAQHFTKPPPRYSEASLVRELEKRGIGRPSTYASIISTIQDRGYVTLNKRRFYAEKIGEIVTDRLVESFADLLDYSFTAGMEQDLDQIASGDRQWLNVLDTFYGGFSRKLAAAARPDGMRPNAPTETRVACATCDRPMQIRSASTGVFLGCSGYSLPPKERCTQTVDLTPADEAADADRDDEGESRALRAKRRCPLCGTAMDSYLVDARRKLHVCGKNPQCAGYEIEEGAFRSAALAERTIECDRCDGEMQLRSGRFGKFFGCTNAECKNTRKVLRNGEPAPPKADPVPMPELRCRTVDDHYVLRDGAAGLFLAASGFPRYRETRAPAVSELKPHAAELDPKHRYLLEAPETDPEGRPAVVRFSRKAGEQYVTSEENGKATRWRAVYRDGRWVEPEPSAARQSARKTAKAAARGRGRREVA
ncbi:MAG: type I DNA topoisomerase [Acidobacteria bacterium]|nr:type I DNA topoisomerase [Acidobacteriota bacterium]